MEAADSLAVEGTGSLVVVREEVPDSIVEEGIVVAGVVDQENDW